MQFSVHAQLQFWEGHVHLDLRELCSIPASPACLLLAMGLGQVFPAPLPALRDLCLALVCDLRHKTLLSFPKTQSFSQPQFVLSGALWTLAALSLAA